MKVSGACAFARSNTSHYSITVIEAEGCRGGPRGSPVSDPFPPPVAITTDQIGTARQKSYWISAAKAGRFQDIHGVKHHLRHAIPARTSPKRCFLSDVFLFFFFNLSHLNTCGVKLKRLLRIYGSGLLEQRRRKGSLRRV